tara:strand:+ start:7275 stop:8753 length:1479 start_codon:yes stop_codon:yes gene_type:complete
MIGKALHIILKDKIEDLNNGAIYPVVMPQNANYNISSSTNYPAIVYHNFTEYIVSKDDNPNMIYTKVMLQVISNTYKSMDSISRQVRDVLDHYVDKSLAGLADVPGYYEGGNNHSFIGNIDISHIFYMDEEDEYFDKLNIFTRRLEYDVYYYDDVLKLNYDIKNSDGYTPTNPLILAYDFTQKELMRRGDGSSVGYEDKVYAGSGNPYDLPIYVFNKLGKTKCLKYIHTTNTYSNPSVLQYLTAGNVSTLFRPTYTEATGVKSYLYFTGKNILQNSVESAYPNSKINLPFGAMFIMVYKPEVQSEENYLLGAANGSTDENPIILSHKKGTTDITIKFNPNGKTFDGASRERTLISSTNSAAYWGGDYHFLCLSLGGSKDYTGGTVNQAGWFEYFNSVYNPKLTTGQILKNNSIAGNTDTMTGGADERFWFSQIGTITTGETSGGFRMYEFLLFIPNEAQTHNINVDAAPFQPTDIIYKKVKDYIYEKYKSLK